jgi:hypothetical protein
MSPKRKEALMSDVLSIDDANDLQTILTAAQRCAKVARAFGGGEVIYGTARSIGTQAGAFLTSEDDVRNGYLRVTTQSGLEAFWPVRELMREAGSGEFALYDW